MGHRILQKTRLFSLLLVLLGNILYALSAKLFLLPSNLISCGTTGIALAVSEWTGIPLSAFILVFNLVMLGLGWAFLGRQFALSTVFSSLFYPVALEALNLLLGDIRVTEDLLLNAIFAGFGLGASLGMVIRGGASTGGMDIPPLLLQKFFRVPVPVSLWAFDFTIMLLQMTYHSLEDLLYGLVLLISVSIALNKVLFFGTSKTEVKIVSPKASQIRDAILSQVDRGVTILHGQGGYSRQETEVILSIVSNYEMAKMERLARDIDPNCFMIVSRVTEVWGRGFSWGKKYRLLGRETAETD